MSPRTKRQESGARRARRAISIAAALAIGMSTLAAIQPNSALGAGSASNSATKSVQAFANPSLDAKPMARFWFTDAGAGASTDGLALVADHITQMAASGFGGVEISYLADDSSITNDELATVGWGTENWKRIMKTLLKTANAIPGGFKIDITITAHWPPAVNTIDPNDDAHQQQATMAYRKVTAADVAAGSAALPLPTQRTEDYYGTGPSGGGPLKQAPFLFVDKFTAATLAKVTAVSSDGTPTFELASLTDLTADTSRDVATPAEIASGDAYLDGGVYYAGYAAGIPDAATAAAMGLNYTTDIVDQFGPDPASPSFTGKIDADGNRKRMADWQYRYTTDLSGVSFSGYTPSAGSDYAVGDYVLIGSYHQGTGQLMSGGASSTMHNRVYATDYFSADGVQAIFDYWADYLLDAEMVQLLKQNGKYGTSIFEDSIEIHKSSPIWTANLMAEATAFNGYNTMPYAPVMASGNTSLFDDATEAARIIEDYNLTLGNLYATKHADLIKDWAASFGYTYRAQAYPLDGLDVGAAAAVVDIPEGDNSGSGDMLRTLKGANNLGRQKIESMETTTFGASLFSTWKNVARVVNSDISDGVNRAIFHGTAFTRNFNGYRTAWPGWNFWREFGRGGFSNYNARQIWWSDADTFSNFVARSQGVMQAGQAKVDVAVLVGSDAGYVISSGNSMQELMDAGYSYNILTQALLDEPTAVVSGGVLDPDGSEYQALVVKDAGKLSVATLDKLLNYAGNGLPIVIVGNGPTRVYGTSKTGNTDAAMLTKWATLTGMSNVSQVADAAAVLPQLQSAGVAPKASYDIPMLETSSRVEGKTTYYYLFNAATLLSAAAAAGDTQIQVSNASSLEAGDSLLIGSGSTQEKVEIVSLTAGGGGATLTLAGALKYDHPMLAVEAIFGNSEGQPVSGLVDQSVTLTGAGTPYVLDAWTDEISPLPVYTRNGNSITFKPQIGAEEAMFVALIDDGNSAPYATSVSGGDLLVDSAKLEHHAFSTGDYQVTVASGNTGKFTVSTVPADVTINDGWKLSLESWGPDPAVNAVNPSASKKTTVEFSNVTLGDWSNLPATAAQLSDLGVSAMSEVSGIGTYSTSFILGKEWRNAGAVLYLTHLDADMIAEIRVNGQLVDDIDQFSNSVDLGGLLEVGTNEIIIKLDTNLKRRYWVENSMGSGVVTSSGLAGVFLDAYTITRLTANAVVIVPPADTEVLAQAIATADGLAAKKADFTAASYQNLVKVVAAAKTVLANPNATQAQVDAAATSVTKAIAALVPANPVVQQPKPTPTYVTKVKFGQSKVTLAKGKSVTIRPGVYFTKGAATYTSRVTYKSSNTKVAKVDAYGNVKALKAGTAKITATSKLTAKNGKKLSATYTVTVVKKGTKTKVTKLTLPGVPKTLKVGQTLWLTATYTAKGNAQPVKVTYTSLKSGIAGIDAVGKLTGVSKGKDTIVVKAGGKTTKYTITVK